MTLVKWRKTLNFYIINSLIVLETFYRLLNCIPRIKFNFYELLTAFRNFILPCIGDYIIQVMSCIQGNSWMFFILYNVWETIPWKSVRFLPRSATFLFLWWNSWCYVRLCPGVLRFVCSVTIQKNKFREMQQTLTQ